MIIEWYVCHLTNPNAAPREAWQSHESELPKLGEEVEVEIQGWEGRYRVTGSVRLVKSEPRPWSSMGKVTLTQVASVP